MWKDWRIITWSGLHVYCDEETGLVTSGTDKIETTASCRAPIKVGGNWGQTNVTKMSIEELQVNKNNGQYCTSCIHALPYTPYNLKYSPHILHTRLLKQQKSVWGPSGKYQNQNPYTWFSDFRANNKIIMRNINLCLFGKMGVGAFHSGVPKLEGFLDPFYQSTKR